MLNKSPKNVTCENCAARKKSLFTSLCDSQLKDLDAEKSCAYYKKNQPVFIEGSFSRGVFCINGGKVKIFTRGEGGKEQIIHIASDGEVIGFRSMFSEEPYQLSATTLEESNICFIPKENFLDMIDENSVLRKGILKNLSKELGERAVFITNMAQKSVRERLAFSLLILDEIYGEEMINLSREDMANFIGTATETLIRLLKDFKEEGMIEIYTRKLQVTDRQKLLRLSGK